ncbi:hypothetical protein EMCRGX_G018739 [Ephydatia muelleri]|eukprot:Em0012g1046a
MPPKKGAQAQGSKKTQEKKKDKVIEDKTFGLKNKKGKKQQQFIQQVTSQVKYGQQSLQKKKAEEIEKKKKKEEEEKQKAELNSLLKPVAQAQKVSAGADPKSVLCVFFKQGQCGKGDKCKFSHDLSLEGKAEKRSMYVDARDMEDDTMDKWDEEKLKEVVKKKHDEEGKPKTDIVCKFFLQAIEKGLYGWFWECPNGGDKCMYRHALPPGFVLKQKKKEGDEEEQTISLEELVEQERQKLASSGVPLTKVTLDSFLAWKDRKIKERREKDSAESEKKKEAFKAGRTVGISGREMFEFNPELVGEDDLDEDGGEVVYQREEDQGDEQGALDVTLIKAVADTPNPLGPMKPSEPRAPGAVGGAVGGDDEFNPYNQEYHSSDESDGDERDDSDGDQQEEEGVPVDEALFDAEELDALQIDDEAGED